MPQYVVGHAETVRAVERALGSVPGLFLAGHSYHGVGIPDTIRTAEEAARSALAYLRIRREEKEVP
jgi:oxygen-dependent protoporphyrinogen oxidase